MTPLVIEAVLPAVSSPLIDSEDPKIEAPQEVTPPPPTLTAWHEIDPPLVNVEPTVRLEANVAVRAVDICPVTCKSFPIYPERAVTSGPWIDCVPSTVRSEAQESDENSVRNPRTEVVDPRETESFTERVEPSRDLPVAEKDPKSTRELPIDKACRFADPTSDNEEPNLAYPEAEKELRQANDPFTVESPPTHALLWRLISPEKQETWETDKFPPTRIFPVTFEVPDMHAFS